MERLTEKVLTPENRVMYMPNTNSHLETMEKGVVFDYFKMWQSLGRFEDLMEKYGLNIISDIEDVFLGFKHIQQENQALKERWQKLKEFVYQYTSLAKECQSDSQASRMAQANKIYAKMEQMEEEE